MGMVWYIHGVRVIVHGHHLKIIHVKDDKVKPEANQWKTNDVQEGTINGVQEGSGVISDDPEYNPKEDEVVVHKTVKALKEPGTKRPGVKKIASKKRKSSEASAAMPLGRVMAPPPGQTKRILESDEPDRITRQKATMAAATDHQESVVHLLLTGMMSSVKKNNSLCFNQASSPSLLLVHFANGSDHENFEINTDSETIKYACKDFLQKSSKNRCHNIKKKYFDTVAANKVSTKSPVPDLADGEWQALVQMWSTPRHKLEMEKMKDAPVPEGQEPKSHAEIVEEVLKTEVKQSTFHRNVGLKLSSNNYGKGTAVVAAHVRASAEAGEVRASS
ncbi:hypothetical protein D1007_37178 [Hordeum vulgare]|nr:hypothetical protein D1007_37178 [Hordeum vulgare]